MLDLLVILSSAAVVALPFYPSLAIVKLAQGVRRHVRPLLAFSFGMSTFFFVDSFRDSAYLGGDVRVSDGILLFLTFLVVYLILVRSRFVRQNGTAFPLLLLLAVGLHSTGESSEVLSLLQSEQMAALTTIYLPGFVGFTAHKLLEGLVFTILLVDMGKERSRQSILSACIVLALLSLVGATIGSLLLVNSTYLFAAGTAGDLFLMLYILERLIARRELYLYSVSIIGFSLIYFLGFLHSIA
jgi:hypothetical protein